MNRYEFDCGYQQEYRFTYEFDSQKLISLKHPRFSTGNFAALVFFSYTFYKILSQFLNNFCHASTSPYRPYYVIAIVVLMSVEREGGAKRTKRLFPINFVFLVIYHKTFYIYSKICNFFKIFFKTIILWKFTDSFPKFSLQFLYNPHIILMKFI